MKKQNTNYWKIMLAAIGTLSATGTVLGDEEVGLRITPELTARWWQWAVSIPSSVHPLTEKSTDPNGDRYCMVGQEGGEWFLGGTFKVVDVTPESKQAQSAGNEQVVNRKCTIPLGKTILIPVLNAECDTAGELALKNPVPEDLLAKTAYLRECAKTFADAVDKNTATAFFGPYDETSGNWTQNPVNVRQVYTIFPFSITYSPDNILSSGCGDPLVDDFLCEPNPNPSLAEVDGYWAHVRPPKPGTYKLQTFGQLHLDPDIDFALRVTYTLTVVGPKDQ